MGDVNTRTGPPGEPVSQIQTKPPFVAFQPSNVPPTQYLYLQLNDQILVRVLSNAAGQTVQLLYRYLTPAGEIKEGQFLVNTSAGIQTAAFPLGEGWLISIGAQLSVAGAQGSWAHIQIAITRNLIVGGPNTIFAMVWQGYIYSTTFNGWPGTPAKEAFDGAGMPRGIVGTLPAAGADILETVPSTRRWQLISLTASLTTSATVANRIPAFILDAGGNVFFQWGGGAAQPASTTVRYNFVAGIPTATDANGNVITPAPTPSPLKANFRIRTLTTGIQAGDQWTAPIYEVVEWGAYDA